MVNAATPAAAEARNSRRLMSSFGTMVILSPGESIQGITLRFECARGIWYAESRRFAAPAGCRIAPNMDRAPSRGYSFAPVPRSSVVGGALVLPSGCGAPNLGRHRHPLASEDLMRIRTVMVAVALV